MSAAEPPDAVRVVLADDHPIVRSGLRALLESLAGLEVVGEAADGNEALRLAVTLQPDVVVLDLEMPVMDGVAASREIRRRAPKVGILVLTMYDDAERAELALRAGAHGYLVKGSAQTEIARAIATVADHSSYLGASVADPLLQRLSRPREAEEPLPGLTPRERDVLRLLCEGLSNGAIAQRLALSPKTVANHVSAIFPKLGVVTRSEAIAVVHRAGLIR